MRSALLTTIAVTGIKEREIVLSWIPQYAVQLRRLLIRHPSYTIRHPSYTIIHRKIGEGELVNQPDVGGFDIVSLVTGVRERFGRDERVVASADLTWRRIGVVTGQQLRVILVNPEGTVGEIEVTPLVTIL